MSFPSLKDQQPPLVQTYCVFNFHVLTVKWDKPHNADSFKHAYVIIEERLY